MLRRRASLWALAALLVVALAGVWACSKSSSPTSPAGGGGGAKELNSGDFGPSATFQHRFMAAGSFPYHCVHHSPMTGTVTVSAAATDTVVDVSIMSATSPFPAASVKTGGRVVWTNNTTMVHTVTSN
jgi:plastocyanin